MKDIGGSSLTFTYMCADEDALTCTQMCALRERKRERRGGKEKICENFQKLVEVWQMIGKKISVPFWRKWILSLTHNWT